MILLKPDRWIDYELIDSGCYRKLEKFGKYILSRPEPQALWKTSLSEKEWNSMSHAVFNNLAGEDPYSEGKGKWITNKPINESWNLNYKYGNLNLIFRLSLGGFKHVGIFPEQAVNWDYIYEKVNGFCGTNCKVLNLFAYTGGASLAARAAGAEVYHVDSVKQVISWAGENLSLSGMSDVHWVLEDAFSFVQREVKRGKKYQGIILDPPAYGRGPAGEKWMLTSGLLPILELCSKLLDRNGGFLVLNTYSLGFSSLITDNMVKDLFPDVTIESGELLVEDKSKHRLPLGSFTRFSYR